MSIDKEIEIANRLAKEFNISFNTIEKYAKNESERCYQSYILWSTLDLIRIKLRDRLLEVLDSSVPYVNGSIKIKYGYEGFELNDIYILKDLLSNYTTDL
jgi:hypothetical protein